jgi:tRNA threonylcarbamoyladenosine biosynthesis protein TsaB
LALVIARMNVLVLDTSTERGAIGLATGMGVEYAATTEAARRHGRDLIPRVAALLAESGLSARDIDLFGVGLGPGSYTGLRVGVSAAKTLAYATGAAIVGFDSLEAVARNAPPDALRISVVADAQRGDVYVAEFGRPAPEAPLETYGSSRIEPLAGWLDRLEPGVFVLGPGLDSPKIRAAMPREYGTSDAAPNYPDGRRLIELARAAWISGRRANPWLLEPHYLRRSAAEEQWDSRNPPRLD